LSGLVRNWQPTADIDCADIGVGRDQIEHSANGSLGRVDVAKLAANMDMNAGEIEIRIIGAAGQQICDDVGSEAKFRAAVPSRDVRVRIGCYFWIEAQCDARALAEFSTERVQKLEFTDVFNVEPADAVFDGPA
jgi:hypothetical protein